jgi:hypothetical protein
MFPLLIALSVLSLIAMITGIVWTLTLVGQTQRRSGPEVGAEIVADQMSDEADENTVLAQRTAFKGKATSIQAEAEFSFVEIKGVLKAGKWREVLPILLAMGGLLGLLAFGSLALLVGVDNKLFGLVVVGVAMYAVVRTLISFAQA